MTEFPKIPEHKREAPVRKIIGVSPEDNDALLLFFRSKFEKFPKNIPEKEISLELAENIAFLDDKMREFVARYSGTPVHISTRSVHIFDKSKLSPEVADDFNKKIKNIGAQFSFPLQQIIMFTDYEGGDKLQFLQSLVHEMLHASSFQSAQKTDKGPDGETMDLAMRDEDTGEVRKISLEPRRIGFGVNSKKAPHFFRLIDEATITELAIRFEYRYFGMLPHPLPDFIEKMDDLAEEVARDPTSTNLKQTIAALKRKQFDDGSREVVVRGYSYRNARKKLNDLIDELFLKNGEQFNSREDVFELFARGCLQGNLIPVARLIEKTYGKGSFRKLGEEMKRVSDEVDTAREKG